MLNYDNYNTCNDVTVINKEGTLKPIASFVKVLGNEQQSEKVQKAKKLSEELGIPCIEIDKALCRERLDLSPLTEKEERDLKVDKNVRDK